MKTNKYSGTKTEQNLRTAFSGESEARNKYTFFASTAKKEGYEQIAALFQKTADNEKEHAKMWFKELQGIGSTADNLLSAAEGENYEWTDMYDSYDRGATFGATILSPRPQRKRAFPSWRRSSASSARSSAITKSATARCCATSRPPRSLKRARSRSGSAATAATSSSAPRPPTSAPPATTPRATSKSTRRIIENRQLKREPQAVPAALLLFTYPFGSRMQIVVPLPSSL